MSDLTDFLLARIAEDEEIARAAGGAQWWHSLMTPAPTARHVPDELTKVAIDSGQSLVAYEVTTLTYAEHIVYNDPARVLADCEAKRRIVEIHHPHDHHGEHGEAQFCDECQWDHGDDSPRIDNQPVENFGASPCRTLAVLALPYADHPDFRAEWRPSRD